MIAHHPIAEAANTGGVLARDYLNLYKITVFELHEAFHGLHPGRLHGSKAPLVLPRELVSMEGVFASPL